MALEAISKSVASVLGKTARQRGLTVDAYLKQLIAEDVELDRVARTKTFAELAIPFQKAATHLSDSQLDALVRPRLSHRGKNPSKTGLSKRSREQRKEP